MTIKENQEEWGTRGRRAWRLVPSWWRQSVRVLPRPSLVAVPQYRVLYGADYYGQYYRGQSTTSTATVEDIVAYTLHSAPYSALYSEGSAAKASRDGGPAVLGTSYGLAMGLAVDWRWTGSIVSSTPSLPSLGIPAQMPDARRQIADHRSQIALGFQSKHYPSSTLPRTHDHLLISTLPGSTTRDLERSPDLPLCPHHA